ncbi:M24 family metallopeptidase [Natrinema longum]|uniref:M24 family metallopeptidase n=1 Tax=Natrinema longum TaxID=370324 RepID=A0A8A2UCU6_9EURY|nr:M24 family metallopeptidase [Natrinema longum]MBZ6495558.1 peptidase M24 [Natrinema longum]QSW86477.1 M24 family metallopeptidase [Natrinema longum]
MTGRTDRDATAGGRVGDRPGVARQRRDHAADVFSRVLADRDATAVVHVGTARDPGLRYACPTPPTDRTAIAYVGADDEWLVRSAGDDASGHPARRLATALADRGLEGTVLTPPRVPHDAALYLEGAGVELASTDALERARATKTDGERAAIAAAQRAAAAGIRRAASLLADTTVVDGLLAVGGGPSTDAEPVTPTRLRTAIDEAIVRAGAFPVGNTAVNPDSRGRSDPEEEPLRPGEPIVLEAAPRGPTGYYGGLVRTLVVDGDGGRERRVHVGVTQSFRSARSMLTAGPESVTAVAADLEAEVRSFGFGEDDAIETRVSGVGLEPRERPIDGGDDVGPGSVVRLDVAGQVGAESRVRIADVLAVHGEGERPDWLAAPSQSLEPTALLE